MAVTVKIAENDKDLEQVYWVRKVVFIDEQMVPEELEVDDLESFATHFLAVDGEKPIGAGRMRQVENYAKLERICVLTDERGKHVGQQIMDAIEVHAKSLGLSLCKLEAQVHAIPFYEKLGYNICSEEFMDAGIPHRTMQKNI